MLINRKTRIENQNVQVSTLPMSWGTTLASYWPGLAVGLLFCGLWGAVIFDMATVLPTQAASWLTFAGLLVAPGYLLADVLVRRLDLDWLERLSLAFVLGVAVMSIPGLVALLQHWRVDDLAQAWVWITFGVVVLWAFSWLWIQPAAPRMGAPRWTWDERLLLLLIAVAFLLITPILNQHKIDGDTLAVGSFTADAMAGQPLNQAEPLFGTDLGPGVRMAFNQSLPMIYLWSYWSHIDPMTLMGSATRVMFALWALLATYMLGKSAGVGVAGSLNGRRIGLFAVAIQLLIYLAAPFFRGDNVSLFFFERIAADKFLVPVTILPVAFALAIRFVRLGEWQIWAAGAAAAFAVSAIHPLVAAMLALGLAAFGGVHLLTRLREGAAYRRVAMLAGLVAIVMILPLVQLVLSRGEDPLAASYPSTLEGWDVGRRQVPALPYFYLPTLDIQGPLPDLSQIEAQEALTATDPFLIWRFAVNMERRRLILFDVDRYISDPNIFLEPPYLLALLALPFLFRRVRTSLGAQFVIATTAAVLFVMYNPVLTPLLGGLVMPWILWRFVWMFPYALILALALAQLLSWLAATLAGYDWRILNSTGAARLGTRLHAAARRARTMQRYGLPAMVLLAALAAGPAIVSNLQTLQERAGFPYFFPRPENLLNRLDSEIRLRGPATVLADADLSVTIPAYVAQAHIVAHRIPTTSEVFPAHRQDEALQRLIDQDAFYRARYLTADAVNILNRYAVDYVIVTGGSNLDVQLRLLPQSFELLFEDQSYALYGVGEVSPQARVIRANSALAQRQWDEAETLYRAELTRDPGFAAAWAGLAEIAHARGEFAQAIEHLKSAQAAVPMQNGEQLRGEQVAIAYRLGQVMGDSGRLTDSIDTFQTTVAAAPHAARFHMALGDACLRVGRMDCARDAFADAVAQQNLPDETSRTVALADMWRQRGYLDQAIVLYERAANDQSQQSAASFCLFCGDGSRIHQLILAGAYQEAGRFAEAEALLELLRARQPLSPDVWAMTAALHAAQDETAAAVEAYNRAIRILELTGRESIQTRLALTATLLDASVGGGRTAAAQAQLDWILRLEPNRAVAHSLQGDLHAQLFRAQDALTAYANAFRLDPTSVPVYFALSNQYRRLGGAQTDVPELLQAALRANPQEATLALALGDQLQRRGDPAGAVDSYLIALDLYEQRGTTSRLNPRVTGHSRAYAYVQLAAVHEDLGEIERAMNFYGAAVAGAPDAAWAQVAYGHALRRQNQPVLAEGAFRQALAADSEFIPAYLGLADLQSAQGLREESSELRAQALEIAMEQLAQGRLFGERDSATLSGSEPGPVDSVSSAFNSDVFDLAALSGSGAVGSGVHGDTGQGALVNELLVTLADDELRLEMEGGATVLNLLGRLAETTGQIDALLELYARTLVQAEREGWYPTTRALYHKGMGDLYLLRNRPDAAVDAYRKAVALDEGWLQARLGLVNALSTAGQTSQAVAELEALFEAEPGASPVQIALAQHYAQAGRGQDALTLLGDAVAMTPGNAQAQIALGQLYQDRGDVEAAEAVYLRVIEAIPGAVEAHTAYATLLLAQSREEDAASILNGVYEIDRSELTVYLLSAVLAQRRGEPERAAEWLADAALLPDVGGANLVAIADLYGRFGLHQAGLRFLEDATAQHPDQVELRLRQARTQRALGAYGDALATLLSAAELDHSDARLTAELAELYLAQGRRQIATVTYRQATILDPTEEAYVLRLAELLRDQGDYDQAENMLRQGLRRVAQPATLFTALSELYLRLGRTSEAETLLTQALAALDGDVYDSQASALLVGMGTLLEAQALRSLGPADSAEQWYLDALARVGEQPDIHAALGDHYLRRGRSDKALIHYETALTLAPAHARYYLGLGAVYTARNDDVEAETALQQAIRLEPGLIDAYYQLVDIYRSRRDWDAARDIFVQAKQVAPANGEVHVRYAAFLLERGETELGMDLLSNAPSISPTARTMVARAGVYAKLRRTDAAIVDLQQAIAWEPGYVDAYIALGDVLRDFGNNQAASEAYGNAIRLNPGLGFGRLRVTRSR